MPLQPGAKLGSYEVVEQIAVSSTREVYKASDTRVNRPVVVKVLLSQFSEDLVKKEQFEREARTIAALNHPRICAVLDIGHQDGIDYLVMEYLEGETLAE